MAGNGSQRQCRTTAPPSASLAVPKEDLDLLAVKEKVTTMGSRAAVGLERSAVLQNRAASATFESLHFLQEPRIAVKDDVGDGDVLDPDVTASPHQRLRAPRLALPARDVEGRVA
jgi:hypothetical protein